MGLTERISEMVIRMLTLVFFAPLTSSTAGMVCEDYTVSGCTQDPNAQLFSKMTQSQEICQMYCALEEGCQFYTFYNKIIDNVNCHLYGERFSQYVRHCTTITGPLNQLLPGKCLTPEENSCDIHQHENCNIVGTIIEKGLYAPDVFACEELCFVNQGSGCKYWEWNREEFTCNLYDWDEIIDCWINFGSRAMGPEYCEATTATAPWTTTAATENKTTTTTNTCPLENSHIFGDYCYTLNDEFHLWWEAEEECATAWEGHAGHLASIHSEEENDFLKWHNDNNPFFVGGSGDGSGVFTWSDGSDWDYTSWKDPSQPSIPDGCVVYQNKQWSTEKCGRMKKFYCKYLI